jgi:hypothetical protein
MGPDSIAFVIVIALVALSLLGFGRGQVREARF